VAAILQLSPDRASAYGIMKRLTNIILIVVVVLVSATCPYAQTRPRRVTPPSNTLAEETSRNRTVERPIETSDTRETPVERRPAKHHNWKRILGTAAIIGVSVAAGAAGGACTPSRDVIRTGPR
jgi:hypothetical protein